VGVEPWINPSGDELYFTNARLFGSVDGLPDLSTYVDILGRITLLITDRLSARRIAGRRPAVHAR